MLDNLKKYKIVLASNSPRRRELLQGLGLDFEVRTLKGIDESYPSSLKGEDIPKFISGQKAKAYLQGMADDELIITADTIVYCDGEVLGKPCDDEDAARMLRRLSGKTHQVITGVSVITKQTHRVFATTSLVQFDNISDEDIISLNIPTGVPLVYELDDEFKPLKHYYLGNADEIAAKVNAVANQANAKK